MAELSHQIIIEDLISQFGNSISDIEVPYGMLTFTCEPAKIPELFEYLFFHKQFQFRFLTDLCGVHFPDNKGKELGVVYHVHSWLHNIYLRVKTFVPIENPRVPTLTKLYASANWQERETYDFYGIIFDGHPNLTRILNVDDMDYHPMRKEYPLEDATRRDKEDLYFGR
ncbi:MAG: NADH-quinone oxidoreductase subunit C [Bacteroidia bacterium]|nr:NADH-quinone oxidoreductase subunit C [Bacteroidia bacterium]MDW8300843.1 NADH-quinone oxidoreductase subunit C [Bacteroidia bacterium]